MQENCDDGRGVAAMVEALLTGGGIIFLLWWWSRRRVDNSIVKIDKAVNTDLEGEIKFYKDRISQSDIRNKEKKDNEDNGSVWEASSCNWKAIWVGEDGDMVMKRHRSELTLDLGTGKVSRKHQVMRQKNTHVIAAL